MKYLKVYRWVNIIKKIVSKITKTNTFPATLKYWFGFQQGKSYLMGKRYHFNLG